MIILKVFAKKKEIVEIDDIIRKHYGNNYKSIVNVKIPECFKFCSNNVKLKVQFNINDDGFRKEMLLDSHLNKVSVEFMCDNGTSGIKIFKPKDSENFVIIKNKTSNSAVKLSKLNSTFYNEEPSDEFLIDESETLEQWESRVYGG